MRPARTRERMTSPWLAELRKEGVLLEAFRLFRRPPAESLPAGAGYLAFTIPESTGRTATQRSCAMAVPTAWNAVGVPLGLRRFVCILSG